MKRILSAALFLGLPSAAQAETIESAYTDLVIERDCSVFSSAGAEGGDFASFACNGYLGYPVLVYSGDLRESVFYGFPPQGDHAWESFDAFNSSGGKIEWRVAVDGGKKIPFAAIHRWTVSADPENPDRKIEVLVVEKVGQVEKQEGCAVGYVVATGNPKANETARRIADEQVRDFACGADEPVQVEGEAPVPSFSRQ
jgi:hypothetical protein